MRIPQILPRRRVETNNFCYVPETEAVRELQAENERLRMQLLGACDRANNIDDTLHQESLRTDALCDIIADLTNYDRHAPLHCDHLDALPIGTVVRVKGLAWTRIGIDYASGRSLWLTPTKDDTVDSIDLDDMGATVTLAWVPTEKEKQA
jgi:hypothetical protein